MKVMLIQAYLGRKELPVFPLGLAMLAAVLPGHDVKIYDPNVSDEPYNDLRTSLAQFQPEVVGISLRNIDNQQGIDFFYYFETMEPTLKIIREICPKCSVAIGGAGYSMFAEKIMQRLDKVDFGVYLEGEESFPELLDNLGSPEVVKGIFYRNNGSVVFSGPRPLPDFSRLPFPRKDLVDISKYSTHQEGIGIQTRRGCPLSCCYCTYPTLNGNKIRERSVQSVVDEVEDWMKRGVSSFIFSDALFTLPLDHATAICDEILKRKLKVRWSAWAEPRFITREFLLLAREAGCTFIAYTPDALSSSSLKALRKAITKEDVIKVYRLATEIKGIKTGFGFFVNPPQETLRGFLETLWFFIKGNLVLRIKNGGGVGLNWIRIEPDTRIFDIALSENVITRTTEMLPPAGQVRHAELFYSYPPLKKYDWIARSVLTSLEFSKTVFRAVTGRQGHGH
jgi:radical SAM superfamily enzyme YgiQ (UPF0313 family)